MNAENFAFGDRDVVGEFCIEREVRRAATWREDRRLRTISTMTERIARAA